MLTNADRNNSFKMEILSSLLICIANAVRIAGALIGVGMVLHFYVRMGRYVGQPAARLLWSLFHGYDFNFYEEIWWVRVDGFDILLLYLVSLFTIIVEIVREGLKDDKDEKPQSALSWFTKLIMRTMFEALVVIAIMSGLALVVLSLQYEKRGGWDETEL